MQFASVKRADVVRVIICRDSMKVEDDVVLEAALIYIRHLISDLHRCFKERFWCCCLCRLLTFSTGYETHGGCRSDVFGAVPRRDRNNQAF